MSPMSDAKRAMSASGSARTLLATVTDAVFSDGARDADGCPPEMRAQVQERREAAVDAMLAYVADLESRAGIDRGTAS